MLRHKELHLAAWTLFASCCCEFKWDGLEDRIMRGDWETYLDFALEKLCYTAVVKASGAVALHGVDLLILSAAASIITAPWASAMHTALSCHSLFQHAEDLLASGRVTTYQRLSSHIGCLGLVPRKEDGEVYTLQICLAAWTWKLGPDVWVSRVWFEDDTAALVPYTGRAPSWRAPRQPAMGPCQLSSRCTPRASVGIATRLAICGPAEQPALELTEDAARMDSCTARERAAVGLPRRREGARPGVVNVSGMRRKCVAEAPRGRPVLAICAPPVPSVPPAVALEAPAATSCRVDGGAAGTCADSSGCGSHHEPGACKRELHTGALAEAVPAPAVVELSRSGRDDRSSCCDVAGGDAAGGAGEADAGGRAAVGAHGRHGDGAAAVDGKKAQAAAAAAAGARMRSPRISAQYDGEDGEETPLVATLAPRPVVMTYAALHATRAAHAAPQV